MNKLAEEAFGQNVHFWYDGLPLYKDGTYAKELEFSDQLKTVLLLVNDDFHNKEALEYFWYIYGNEQTQDALHEKVRPNIMIRYQSGEFFVRMNIADADFALSLERVLAFETELKEQLKKAIF
ncbi:hypothetical protein I6I20_00915 [Lactococcus garvieae]|nr:hypothetical protein I6I20_00915 [Lactococcus garvieae]